MCHSKLSGLHAFDNMARIHLSLSWLKIERQTGSS